MEPILLYECPKLGARTRLTAEQCERNQVLAEEAAAAPFLCDLGVRGFTSQPLIHLTPCLLCPGVEALSRVRIVPPPVEYKRSTIRGAVPIWKVVPVSMRLEACG
jgi:hypothetical protein